MAVSFAYADRTLRLGEKRRIQRFVEALVSREGKSVQSLQYVFCSDEYLLGINQQFLQHDDFTDIITFDLRADHKGPIEGEIYISTDRVADNALSLGLAFREEMLRVIFHGVLHLCGYKDKRKADKAVMRAKEEEYLLLYASGQL